MSYELGSDQPPGPRGRSAFSIRAGRTRAGVEVVELDVGGITFRKRVDSIVESARVCNEVRGFLEKMGVEFQ